MSNRRNESSNEPGDSEVDDSSQVELLTAPAGGVPEVIDDPVGLNKATDALAAGTGPVAIDAERAHGYRYTHCAYLIQLRRRGSDTQLIDPVALAPQIDSIKRHRAADGSSSRHREQTHPPHRVRHPRSTADPADLSELAEAIDDVEWVVHAATQDLPCLNEVNLVPHQLFDTEVAGRLLGYPRVNLGTLIEEVFSVRLLKQHSAADWSTRPLPPQWLTYAALDVELLVELRDALAEQLAATGKDEWARQEFASLAASGGAVGEVRPDPWRRTSGLHRIRSRRGLAIVAELWRTRDRIAHHTDLAPGRTLPDAGLIEAATLADPNRQAISDLPAFRRRPARHHLDSWAEAVGTALQLSERDLPPLHRHREEPPQPRSWSSKDPQAAERLNRIRSELTSRAGELQLPIENLLTPEYLRRLIWRPPEPISESSVNDRLAGYGARPWQREQTVPLITRSLTEVHH